MHRGVACGLEINPGGRSTRMSLTFSMGIPNPFVLNVKLVTPTNGCAAGLRDLVVGIRTRLQDLEP